MVFEYANGVKLFSYCPPAGRLQCRRIGLCIRHEGDRRPDEALDQVRGYRLALSRRLSNMYQVEHNELFAAIRSGNAINNGDYMSRSSMMAILGRMATYTGQTITWENALASNEQLGPKTYEWGKLAVDPVAMPGITQFA